MYDAPRFRTEEAQRLSSLLESRGTRVFLPYSNRQAFEDRTRMVQRYDEHGKASRSWSYHIRNAPTDQLTKWMESNCGPMGTLWTTVKREDGLDVFFAVKAQATMFKLTWGGR